MPIHLPRAPQTDEELYWVIRSMWGIALPRKSCGAPGHSSPMDAVAHAYFSKPPGMGVWYAFRGGGKSQAEAGLGLTKGVVADAGVTVLGGSMTQSQNVQEHMTKLLAYRDAPTYAIAKHTATRITTTTGRTIRPIPASQTTVRGPHEPLTLLDEVDEMDWDIYEAAMGQAMEQVNSRGEIIGEYVVAASTWQNPDGTFAKVLEMARDRGIPIFTWCPRCVLTTNGGWMSPDFLERKRNSVSKRMWEVEYLLGEPTTSSRALDLDAVEQYFVDYPEPITYDEEPNFKQWVWEKWMPSGAYALGIDWAKEVDMTVFAVVRYDCYPRRLVYLRRMNRRPYPYMIRAAIKVAEDYRVVGYHDKTGLGNVVHDFIEADNDAKGNAGPLRGFDFTDRKKKSQMLLGYITDFEKGGYELPRVASEFYKAHRNATTADVYGSHAWNAHLPDDLAAMGLAHLAAGRIGGVAGATGAPRQARPAKGLAPLERTEPEEDIPMLVGNVEIIDHPDDGVAVAWLA